MTNDYAQQSESFFKEISVSDEYRRLTKVIEEGDTETADVLGKGLHDRIQDFILDRAAEITGFDLSEPKSRLQELLIQVGIDDNKREVLRAFTGALTEHVAGYLPEFNLYWYN